MVLAVFRSPALSEGLRRFPPAYIYRVVHADLKGYWRFFGRIDEHEGWFFHAPVGGMERSEEGVRALLGEAAGFDFECSFEHVGYWDLRVSIADRFRAGRVFIAGDAAHSHRPMGGYGLIPASEERQSRLKLAAALQGWAARDCSTPTARRGRPWRGYRGGNLSTAAFEDRTSSTGSTRNATRRVAKAGSYARTRNRHVNSYAPHLAGSARVEAAGGVTGAGSTRSERHGRGIPAAVALDVRTKCLRRARARVHICRAERRRWRDRLFERAAARARFL